MKENNKEKNQAPLVNTQDSSEKKGSKKNSLKKFGSKKFARILGILAIVIFFLGGISILVYKNLSLFVVGKIDNSFISRKELNNKLLEVYGQSMLDEMINEKIVSQNIKKANVEYTQEEYGAKIADIESQIQSAMGMSLDAYLEAQGMSKGELEKNVVMQLSLEKILASKINISEEAIDAFLEENAEYLTGETDEERREEAVDRLLDQELGVAFQSWLTEKKAEAKVSTFLE